MATILLTFGAVNTQIGEVKVSGNYAKIYDENGSYSGKEINIENCLVAGYNSKYIVITRGNYAKIYDHNGRYTNYELNIENSFIKNVTTSYILVKRGDYTKYYDFTFKYNGKETRD